MKANGSPRVLAFFAKWTTKVFKVRGCPVALAWLVPALFLSSCAQHAAPNARSDGKATVPAAKPGALASRGKLCHALFSTVTVPMNKDFEEKREVELVADRPVGSSLKLQPESRTMTLTYTGPRRTFTFDKDYDVPDASVYPASWKVTVPVKIPKGDGTNGGLYRIKVTASVRFDDDLAHPVESTFCTKK